ncbi:2-methoxy-6-polyprenyl-1,4-benzoquinol methylase, mitochondrial [Commensalibacter sp. Nvir]|uniref:class I SAM-dependent methyltransferase n=1 Tax=Commensalibacter sp. Nvir TaxID=3069817 RepID=UPI002D312D3C|nr:2-methoxy-6-polyprenyl-1,4-benzoquinol methylase, mitochondrial [Commensalibacter sp. Nvir]
MSFSPHTALSADAVKVAYRRWAAVYDMVFGKVSAYSRRCAVAEVNQLPGQKVLEVGVGTGLALPSYNKEKLITGIDLSTDMLKRARQRVKCQKLTNIERLEEMDAEATTFEDSYFDIAVGMFVASVVPHPQRLFKELKRIVKPGGHILFVNHFLAEKGLRYQIEKLMAPASKALGWHPDFSIEALLPAEELKKANVQSLRPFGIFTLIVLSR